MAQRRSTASRLPSPTAADEAAGDPAPADLLWTLAAPAQNQVGCAELGERAPGELVDELPAGVREAIWRGDSFGRSPTACLTTGFAALDAELPGAGWPVSVVIEILQPQFSLVEWRLLLPALAPRATPKTPLVAIAPPHEPYFGGLRQYGLQEHSLILVRAQAPAQRLWATEQALRTNGLAGLIAWHSHARPDQIRRLQACANQCGFPVFLVRPEAAQYEASPAPLRAQVREAQMNGVDLHFLKRRGPAHAGWLRLPAMPPGLLAVVDPPPDEAARSATVREIPGRVPSSSTLASPAAAFVAGQPSSPPLRRAPSIASR